MNDFQSVLNVTSPSASHPLSDFLQAVSRTTVPSSWESHLMDNMGVCYHRAHSDKESLKSYQ
ncbi:MAG TPA: hypothetical protein PKK23_11635 [Nitrospirales bacterium]|nr:hypothetical protein [Nitrospirales bacterium]